VSIEGEIGTGLGEQSMDTCILDELRYVNSGLIFVQIWGVYIRELKHVWCMRWRCGNVEDEGYSSTRIICL
jgi:hypothetical protein